MNMKFASNSQEQSKSFSIDEIHRMDNSELYVILRASKDVRSSTIAFSELNRRMQSGSNDEGTQS